jgi:hypothetical protein
MINRNFTRTILSGAETTAKTKSVTSESLPFVLTTSDFFYLGFKQPFTTRYFDLPTPNTNACTLTVEYCNASGAWVSVEDLIDETQGFTQSGFISWLNFGLWDKSTQAPIVAVSAENETQLDLEYYWVRVSVSANLSAGTTLQSVTKPFLP